MPTSSLQCISSWRSFKRGTGKLCPWMKRKPVSLTPTSHAVVCIECVRLLAYYVAFGAHGPRTDYHPPGSVTKIIFTTLVMCGLGGGLFGAARYFGAYFPIVLLVMVLIFFRRWTNSQDCEQGVARGFQRACSGDEARSDFW